MKKLIPFLVVLFISYNSFSQFTLIPDTNFEQALINLGVDDVLDGQILTSSASAMTNMDFRNQGISDLTGLEDFVSLQLCYVSSNNLSGVLDISTLTSLQDFACSNNSLTDVILPPTIINYYCRNNQLNSIDISNLINLQRLYCNNNQLSSIDTSNNINLSVLDCYDNPFTTNLDLTQNINLTFLRCRNNQLTNLDISNNINLSNLFCNNNQISTLNFPPLSASLFRIDCSSNLLSNLDISMLPILQYLTASNNSITSIDTSNNSNLKQLNFYNNLLTSIDVTNNLSLSTLSLNNNSISTIDVTNNIMLISLSVSGNLFSNLDITNNVNLTFLNISDNFFKRIDVSQNNNLNSFYCRNNQLVYLDLTNTKVKYFDASNNNLFNLKMQNGHNADLFSNYIGTNNPNLTCVEVDDPAYSSSYGGIIFNAQVNFSLDCNYAAIWYDNVWSYLPSITDSAIVLENYETLNQGDLEVKDLTIFPNAQLTVGANSFVKLEQDFINNGSIIIENQGSFLQNDNNATINGTGNYVTKINTTNLLDEDRFTYFSSPVANQNLEVFNTFANMSKLWRFDESIQDWFIVPSTTLMTPAVGYAIQGALDVGQYPLIGNTEFNGVFNNGTYSYPLTFNTGGIDDDNSLVGNPYPSAIDASLLLNNNPNANAFYFWTHDSALLQGGYAGDDYAVWNNSGGIASGSGSPAPSGFIASGQGFFVDAIGSGNFVFNNNVRVTGSNNDFRNSEDTNRNRIWLNLTNSGNLFSQILLNFTEFGTVNLDTKLDAKRLNTSNPISLYSIGNTDNEYFAIQALPSLQNNKIVPLALNVNNENISDLIISIDHLEFQNEFNIYLKDHLLNTIHDLKQADYNFSVTETGINSNRFELIFNRITLDNEGFLNQIQKIIITNNSKTTLLVKTNNNSIITNFKIYDVLGKLLLKMKPNKSSFIIDKTTFCKEGTVLIVNAKLKNGRILNTKIMSN